MSVQSWQIACPRCGWANSGAEVRCMKCGYGFAQRPGMLVAGESQSARAAPPPAVLTARPGGFLPRLIGFIVDT
ncbi:MAG: hypothetical protein QOE92_906, partial [Chloroflexota bacterium]|nr:hypothetical protein [Chloroflexota bacterium]